MNTCISLYRQYSRASNEENEMFVWISNKHYVKRNGEIWNDEKRRKLNPTLCRDGYLVISSKIGGSVHRVLGHAYLGGIPEGMVINHLDGVKTNNCLSNLEITTHRLNTVHAYATGLAKGKPGEDNSQAVLSNEQILEMFQCFRDDMNNDDIGEKFNVHSRYVSLVRHGKRWSHMNPEGEVFPKSFKFKYSPETLLKAYDLVQEGVRNLDISKITGIEKSCVSRIKSGKLYPEFYQRHRGCND